MLPEITAKQFLVETKKGGRTKPWQVLIEEEPLKLVPYFVKVFEPNLINRYSSVSREVFGNVLTKEFDLNVPEAKLIKFDADFIETIPEEELKRLPKIDKRIKYGCKAIDNIFGFSPVLTKHTLESAVDIDTVYAFDCMICNLDRINEHPNILLKKNSAYLIDHELAFMIDYETINKFKRIEIPFNNYKRHIFYPYLQKSRGDVKRSYFNTFEVYLRGLNVNALDSFVSQLQSHGHPVHDYNMIKDYFCLLRENSSRFISLLRQSIL